MTHNVDDQPSGILVGTVAEIGFLIFTIVVAACFGQFGGPFDDWVKQAGLEGSQILILMFLAWSCLTLGILVRKPVLRYGFLICWMILASLMRIFQEQKPLANLVAALGVLVAISLANRISKNRSTGSVDGGRRQ